MSLYVRFHVTGHDDEDCGYLGHHLWQDGPKHRTGRKLELWFRDGTGQGIISLRGSRENLKTFGQQIIDTVNAIHEQAVLDGEVKE